MTYVKCASLFLASFLVLGTNAHGKGGGLFDFIDPCHINDNDCILKSSIKAMPHIIKGNPGLGLPTCDPLHIDDEISGDIGELLLRFKNMKVEGPSRCTLKKIERSSRLKIKLVLECPITATGRFRVGGKLLGFDIEGKGPCEIKTDKIKIEIEVTLKVVKGKDGEEHYKVDKFDYKYDAIDKVHLKFENLYNGDKERAKPIIDIMKKDWKDLLSSFGGPVITEIIKKAVDCINKFFSVAPANQIELH